MTPAKVTEAIRVGCTAADVHLRCSYPECSCKVIPDAIKAAVEWAIPDADLLAALKAVLTVWHDATATRHDDDAAETAARAAIARAEGTENNRERKDA